MHRQRPDQRNRGERQREQGAGRCIHFRGWRALVGRRRWRGGACFIHRFAGLSATPLWFGGHFSLPVAAATISTAGTVLISDYLENHSSAGEASWATSSCFWR